MPIPKLTFDGLTSVYPYMRFRETMDALIERAQLEVMQTSALAGFLKPSSRGWQEAEKRIGQRIWLNPDDDATFAFIGLYCGDWPIQEGVPDLFFFLEHARGSEAQKRFDASGSSHGEMIAKLQADDPSTRWSYLPGGWTTISARRSLVDVARQLDPEQATIAFFREASDRLRTCGLTKAFVDAVPAAVPASKP